MRDFRFSFNVRGIESRDAFVEKCRAAERQGYDTVFAADHLGTPAPFPLLVAAAAATQRLRDFEALPDGVQPPRPVQRHGFGGYGPPLIIGGTGDRILRIAAAHADTVSVAGVYQVKGEAPGTFRLGTAAEAHERVRFARQHARERADEIEWHLLLQAVVETSDRRGAATKLIEQFGASLDMTVDEVLETPFLLIGTVAEMAEQLVEHRERYGFSYLTVHEPFMENFAPVIARLQDVGSP